MANLYVKGKQRLVIAAVLAGAPALAGGCQRTVSKPPREGTTEAGSRAAARQKFDRIERMAFNRRAVELNQSLFWRADANGDGALDPDELVVTWTHGEVRIFGRRPVTRGL